MVVLPHTDKVVKYRKLPPMKKLFVLFFVSAIIGCLAILFVPFWEYKKMRHTKKNISWKVQLKDSVPSEIVKAEAPFKESR